MQWKALHAMRDLPSAGAAEVADVARHDPRDFIRDVLGERPTAKMLSVGIKAPWTSDQERVLEAVRDERRVAVPSGHSSGKTYILARIALWYLYLHPDSIVITTAPTQRQVETVLWGEIRTAFDRSRVPLPGRLLPVEPHLVVRGRWQAMGFTTNPRKRDISATGFQGLHAPHIMAIVDEAAGVDDQIRQGIEGIAVRPEDRIVAIGNPTDVTGWFVTGIKKRTWHVVHIDSRRHPNVVHQDPDIIPGAVSAQWIEERRQEYGEHSPLYMAKVIGLPPEQSQDALIQLSWVLDAQKRWTEPEDAKDDRRGVALGLDIASEGEDYTVLSLIRRGQWSLPDLEGRRPWHTGRNAIEAIELVLLACRILPVHVICLDDTGLGNVVRGRLLQIQTEDRNKANGRLTYAVAGSKVRRPIWIQGVNFGAKSKADLYDLAKDELWWTLREAYRLGEIALPPDDVLEGYGLPTGCDIVAQLTAPIYDTLGPGGSIRVFDKRDSKRGDVEKTRSLPAKSPDFAHSQALALYAFRRLRADAPKEDGRPLAPEEAVERYYRGIIDRALGDKPGNGNGGNGTPGPAKHKPLPWQRGRFR